MDHNSHKETEMTDLKKRLTVAVVLTAVLWGLILLSFMPSFGIPMWVFNLIMFGLATLIQVYVAKPYYRSAWHGLENRVANIDTLVVLGTSAAYLYSVIVTIGMFLVPHVFHGANAHNYFDISATIITFIVLGKYLEVRAKGNASKALEKLLLLGAKTARVVLQGKEVDVTVDSIKVGNIIRVKPGEKIPIDGIIINGSSLIDEALVTGESLPQEKSIGDYVIGSTINKSGTFLFKATKVGQDTVLAQIIGAVEKAQGSKAPIQKLADTVSGYFVPTILIIAGITFVAWYILSPVNQLTLAMSTSIAVLIIASPGALRLATPISVIIATTNAARKGIIIKDAESIELSENLSTIVFDKTGTLTQGVFSVTNVAPTTEGSISAKEVLALAASIQQRSEHPLAQAMVDKAVADQLNLRVPNKFTAYPGRGVIGLLAKKRITIGTVLFMEEQHILVTEISKRLIIRFAGEGKTASLIAADNTVIGVIACADVIKAEAKDVILQLKNRNIAPIMITGDRQEAADAIARQLGIPDVYASILPEGKADIIKRLIGNNRIVAMVGDGVNDAPALAVADVGISMANGSDIAIESAQITLLNKDLRSLITLLDLSKRTMHNIRQNLFFAFAYNIVLIPVAAGVFYLTVGWLLNPILASMAMAASSVTVVGNALRLSKGDSV